MWDSRLHVLVTVIKYTNLVKIQKESIKILTNIFFLIKQLASSTDAMMHFHWY